ncbi:hypothetical protein FS837_005142 [Tulasnella sp. UAMH 9824]|nr:hypothetical protein FS837_005142 [Tulasnella sp. UAMH 9824]
MDLDISPSKIKITSHNQYSSSTQLSPSTVLPSPLDQFRQWFEAAASGTETTPPVAEPEAMSLATSTSTGIPSVRIVLLKQVDAKGFVFFTNYESRKSHELAENPFAALSFHWKEVQRQVRVVGTVEKVSEEDSTAYYKSRPVGSRLGAWASPQSQVIGEGELQKKVDEITAKYASMQGKEADIPRPEFWGGWRVVPTEVEFWAGKQSRLHDRVRYLRDGDGWKIERLAP